MENNAFSSIYLLKIVIYSNSYVSLLEGTTQSLDCGACRVDPAQGRGRLHNLMFLNRHLLLKGSGRSTTKLWKACNSRPQLTSGCQRTSKQEQYMYIYIHIYHVCTYLIMYINKYIYIMYTHIYSILCRPEFLEATPRRTFQERSWLGFQCFTARGPIPTYGALQPGLN